MMRVLILVLSILEAGGTNRVTTTCTSNACFTLHLQEDIFKRAHENCINNGGNLVTMRHHDELENVRSALLAADQSVLTSKLWIGLVLPKGRCTDFNEELHGFKWTSEPTDSRYSNWKKKPSRTCTEKRCVSVSLSDDLKWSDGSCRDRAFYMCKFIFRGTCKPITLEEPVDVSYNLPFLSKPLTQQDGLAMLPHGTMAEIRCSGSEDTEVILSLCDNKLGTFGWTNSERFCARDKKSCEHKNGGCDHICSETAGEIRCECRKGYYLRDDTFSCAHRNNCENSPCESKCESTAAGFSCACPDGFQLARDNVSCVDIDECRQSICGEHRCHNKPGGYFCECKPGFSLVAGKCEDVDECTEFRCDQGCLNSQGSFSCYCYAGYSSSREANGTCIDIDECLNRPCEHTCLNTLGSYRCSCTQKFTLAENGISCVPNPTEKPQNTPTSQENKDTLITHLSQSPDGYGSTVSPLSPNQDTKTDSIKRAESFLGSSWILLCVVGSVIPLLILIVITSVIVIYRWKRSRKTTKKNVTADNYCWVSSGLDNLEKNQR
ncbi:putative complement component C1q receptor [Triplophysa rosa]|uniref:Complement component C1q receptor n=1 Tax=Triplophysa rosa TaxID=992332 RepID=A0A9W7WMH9_TRIRA|nr:putative complement component C1q receptor [Triplophysa rosa]